MKGAALSFWLAADAAHTMGVLRQDRLSIQKLAQARLGHLLFHAARNNPFYARRLQAAGIEWADPVLQRDPNSVLASLSPVSKVELRRAGSQVLDHGELDDDWYSSSSSGSTGEPFTVYYEPRAWGRLRHLIKLRARAACGVRPGDRVALLDAIKPSSETSWLDRRKRWTRISVLQPAPDVARKLESFNPDVLYGLPSALVDAGRVLQQRGCRLNVRAVFTSGELLHGLTRETLFKVYGAPVYDVYGTSETKEIAWECTDGRMHLNADVVHLEAVDDAGQSLPAGEEGDLVATLLVSRAMPLIRYRTGDRGLLLSERCSCGCAMPLLGVITGRAADVLVLRDGWRISPYALTCAIERIPGVLRYQVSQLDQARVRVRAILHGTADRGIISELVRSALRFEVAPFLEADIEFVDRLPTGPRAKFRVVEPLAG